MPKINSQNEIKAVLATQATAIKEAMAAIGPSFNKAIELIFRCRGKVVVTGVGKSGLIAQKMASTLASTGTPAIYLHPAEGMHGSLGVIDKSDVVFAIGKSGESDEILSILPSIQKIGAKTISFTAVRESSMARASDIVLHVPVRREACPLNLAPTTSSTIALVVGDAIAITLMKKRGFGADRFALYHPGGQLGKRLLLKVADVMRQGKNNPVVSKNASIQQLLLEIAEKWTGAASIVDKKKRLIGLVTDYDIRKAFAQGRRIHDLHINDLMNPNPTFIYDDELAWRALEIMESRKKPLTVLPVVNRKRQSVGMVHLHDLVVKGLASEHKKNSRGR